MPQWKPGKQRGENVNVRFSVPVMFRLQGPAPSKGKEIKQADLEEVVVVAYGQKKILMPTQQTQNQVQHSK